VLFDAGLVCWGDDTWEQCGALGAGGATPASVAMPAAVAVTCGAYHTCAIAAGGQVYCWGRNHHLQIGNDFDAGAWPPTVVAGATGAVEIEAGHSFNCIVDSSAAVSFWGSNSYNQFAEDTGGVDRAQPQKSQGLPP